MAMEPEIGTDVERIGRDGWVFLGKHVVHHDDEVGTWNGWVAPVGGFLEKDFVCHGNGAGTWNGWVAPEVLMEKDFGCHGNGAEPWNRWVAPGGS